MKNKYVEQPTKSMAEEEIGTVAKQFHEYKAEATIPKLQVREQPDSKAESIDTISLGQSVTIVEEKNGWGKTKYGKGWVNLKYTRRA